MPTHPGHLCRPLLFEFIQMRIHLCRLGITGLSFVTPHCAIRKQGSSESSTTPEGASICSDHTYILHAGILALIAPQPLYTAPRRESDGPRQRNPRQARSCAPSDDVSRSSHSILIFLHLFFTLFWLRLFWIWGSIMSDACM